MAMTVAGYSEYILASVFEHLCENKKATSGFLAKNAKFQKFWLDCFYFM